MKKRDSFNIKSCNNKKLNMILYIVMIFFLIVLKINSIRVEKVRIRWWNRYSRDLKDHLSKSWNLLFIQSSLFSPSYLYTRITKMITLLIMLTRQIEIIFIIITLYIKWKLYIWITSFDAIFDNLSIFNNLFDYKDLNYKSTLVLSFSFFDIFDFRWISKRIYFDYKHSIQYD